MCIYITPQFFLSSKIPKTFINILMKHGKKSRAIYILETSLLLFNRSISPSLFSVLKGQDFVSTSSISLKKTLCLKNREVLENREKIDTQKKSRTNRQNSAKSFVYTLPFWINKPLLFFHEKDVLKKDVLNFLFLNKHIDEKKVYDIRKKTCLHFYKIFKNPVFFYKNFCYFYKHKICVFKPKCYKSRKLRYANKASLALSLRSKDPFQGYRSQAFLKGLSFQSQLSPTFNCKGFNNFLDFDKNVKSRTYRSYRSLYFFEKFLIKTQLSKPSNKIYKGFNDNNNKNKNIYIKKRKRKIFWYTILSEKTVTNAQKNIFILSFIKAISNVKPPLECRAKRFGGANRNVPGYVSIQRQWSYAMRWIIASAYFEKQKEKKAKVKVCAPKYTFQNFSLKKKYIEKDRDVKKKLFLEKISKHVLLLPKPKKTRFLAKNIPVFCFYLARALENAYYKRGSAIEKRNLWIETALQNRALSHFRWW